MAKVARGRARAARQGPRARGAADRPTTRVRSAARTDNPVPEPPFWGVREIPVDIDELYHHLDTHVLFKLHWGGRGVKGEAWNASCSQRRLPPRLERMWARAGLPAPARAARLLPVLLARATTSSCSTPRTARRELDALHLPAPAQARPHLPGRLLPARRTPRRARRRRAAGGHRRLRGHRADGALEADGEFAEQLFVHGLGVQTAEGLAEWLHAKVRERPRHRARPRAGATRGATRRCPDQSEHVKVEELLDLAQIGMSISRRLRARARAVDARDRRPPPRRDVLRDEVGHAADERPPARRRRDRRQRPRPDAVGRADRRGSGRGRARRGGRGRGLLADREPAACGRFARYGPAS